MTPPRTRMLDDMQLKGYSQRTQEAYCNAVRQLAVHWGDDKSYFAAAKESIADMDRVLQADASLHQGIDDGAWDTTSLRRELQGES